MNNETSNIGKKSFILYYDNQHFFELLEDTKAGRLIKDIYNYEIYNILPNYEGDIALQMAFTGIKNCLDRDKEKYENIVKTRRLNGAKGRQTKKRRKTKWLF